MTNWVYKDDNDEQKAYMILSFSAVVSITLSGLIYCLCGAIDSFERGALVCIFLILVIPFILSLIGFIFYFKDNSKVVHEFFWTGVGFSVGEILCWCAYKLNLLYNKWKEK